MYFNTVPSMTCNNQRQPSPNNNDHDDDGRDGEWLHQSEWVEKMRIYKDSLIQQDIQGWELFEAMTTLSLEHKLSNSRVAKNRCGRCWHDQSHCICAQLNPLDDLLPLQYTSTSKTKTSATTSSNANANTNTKTTATINIRLCILMHHKEYLCAGNSAKLLFSLLPNHTELFLFGKIGEMDRLFQETVASSTCSATDHRHHHQQQQTMILWPGPTAISLPQFLSQCFDHGGQWECETPCSTTGNDKEKVAQRSLPLLQVIVLDGTYTQARNMFTSLRKRWGIEHMPPAVALDPTSTSVFHRAQKSYGKAHHQQKQCKGDDWVQRVSTAESCACLLVELGLPSTLQTKIVQAVIANNQALAYARASTRKRS